MLKKNIRLDKESMELISLFNNISGAIIKDCLIYDSPENSDEVIIFLVKKEDVGKAIGRDGEHVKDLSAKLNKKIDVIPFSESLDRFIKYILNTTKNSIKVKEIEIKDGKNEKRTVIISVRPQDRGKAIGKDGSMIKKIKTLVVRHFEVDNVIIDTRPIN
ncbi:MAG: NusA-like transcription termination signal-binding factor [Candidatus Lokiarchaeota archaeon]|nr:NusA-like transcription termination signal-binding factor [Candidatus Lokiarchaeota archaeon]MBD3200424.1 NusA-like transcription termination signal-binding factor [Candidatus Lokiarchaeota archaeon]